MVLTDNPTNKHSCQLISNSHFKEINSFDNKKLKARVIFKQNQNSNRDLFKTGNNDVCVNTAERELIIGLTPI